MIDTSTFVYDREQQNILSLFYAVLQASPEKRGELAGVFAKELKNSSYPVFIGNETVYLFYEGVCNTVSMLGDITGWKDPLPYTCIEQTNLWHLKLQLPADARIEYLLLVDGTTVLDPFNKFLGRNGLWQQSELAMPEYHRHEYFNEFLYGREGDVAAFKSLTIPSRFLGYDHQIHIYEPKGFEKNVQLPIIYFQDGLDYIRYALVGSTLDKMIEEKRIQPVRAVLVTPPNLHVAKEPNRSTEYGLNDSYVSFFCDELVPFIESQYASCNSPAKRLVAGDSYAGLISFYIAFSHPELFANAYSQSGYFSFRTDKIISLFSEAEKMDLNLYFDIGSFEKIVGADFIPGPEQDFTGANLRMNAVLRKKGYAFRFKVVPEGHTWGNWRRQLVDALLHFFGNDK